MADSIREQIIKAFTARAATLADNPTEFPVRRCRRSEFDGPNRFVVVWDGTETTIDNQYGIQTFQLPIAIELKFRPVDIEQVSSETNAVLAEIVNTMMNADRTFGGLAERIDYASGQPEYPPDGGTLVTITAIFNVNFQTLIGNPYSAA